MAYAFKQIEAHDPNNPGLVAPNASVTIFEPGDPTKTPLTLTTLAGDPLPNPVTVNGMGYGPAFMHATLPQVAWSGGGLTGTFESYEGMRDEAIAARTAAETAAATAGADAAAVADAAIGDATAEAEAAAAAAAAAEAAAASSATAAANSAALVNAPADTAIAAAINGNGATKTALTATILDQITLKAPPLAVVKEVQSAAALRAFRAARSACFAGTGPLNIVAIGDSVTEGRDVGDAARWVTKLRDQLRTRWQPAGITGGEGYVPAYYAATGMVDRFTFGGAASNQQTQYGLGMRHNALASAAGNTMTATFTGTSVKLHYASNSNSGIITVTIDGGAPVAVDTIGGATTTSGHTWTSPALTAGSHTIVLANTSGKTCLIEGISVFNGDETKGVRVLDAGHSGWEADDLSTRSTAVQHGQAVAGVNPHLVIIALGYNDIANGFTSEKFRVDLTVAINNIKTATTADPSFLLAGYPPRLDVSAERWGWFIEAMRDVAETEGCAYVDLKSRAAGINLPDQVHTDAAGHTTLATALTDYLASV